MSSYLTINDKQINVQGIRELKPGISIQQACEKTKKNGIDEVYFTSGGKSYLAYGDSLNISDLAKKQIARASFNGAQADVIAHEDEINSVGEGIRVGMLRAWKDTSNTVVGAVKNIVSSIGPSSAMMVGGGVVGLTALSMFKSTTMSTGSMIGSLSEAIGKGTTGALKLIALTGAVGMLITGVAGAVNGATEAMSNDKDFSTIAAVTLDGTTPATDPKTGTVPLGVTTDSVPISTANSFNPSTRALGQMLNPSLIMRH